VANLIADEDVVGVPPVGDLGEPKRPGQLAREGRDVRTQDDVGDHQDVFAGLISGVLRDRLDTYANVRPIKLWPGVRAPIRMEIGEVDYVTVRENTEGLYASRGNGVMNAWAATDLLFMTRPGVERVCRHAFELARKRNGSPEDGVRRVTCVDKSNVLKSFWFFRTIFDEIAKEYPDIETNHLYADVAARALVMAPLLPIEQPSAVRGRGKE
jgi:isocitrate/isopropylmalate dehydrogenase